MPAPADLQKSRMETCKSCPELTMFNRCRQCGCFMDVKTRLTGAKCPLDKWVTLELWTKLNTEQNSVK